MTAYTSRIAIVFTVMFFLTTVTYFDVETIFSVEAMIVKRSITESIDFIFSNAKAQKYEPCEMFEIPSSVNIPRDFDQVHSFIHSLYFSL